MQSPQCPGTHPIQIGFVMYITDKNGGLIFIKLLTLVYAVIQPSVEGINQNKEMYEHIFHTPVILRFICMK